MLLQSVDSFEQTGDCLYVISKNGMETKITSNFCLVTRVGCSIKFNNNNYYFVLMHDVKFYR